MSHHHPSDRSHHSPTPHGNRSNPCNCSYMSGSSYPCSVKLGKIRERRSCFSSLGGIMSKARQAVPTVTFVDEYCQGYQDLFPAVRSFEHFKYVHVGMLKDDPTQDPAGYG